MESEPSTGHGAQGAQRVLLSVDYPFASMTESVEFFTNLELSPSEREVISHANAERLFGLSTDGD